MTTLILVRHGETDWNLASKLQGRADIPLNITGSEQAITTALAMKNQPWDVLASSPLQRAMRTAEIIAAEHDYPVREIISDNRLRERSYGQAEGTTIEERVGRWPDYRWPDAETRTQLDARVGEVLTDYAGRFDGHRVVVVTHGGWIRSAMRIVTRHDPAYAEVTIPNTSRTTIRFADGHWALDEFAAV